MFLGSAALALPSARKSKSDGGERGGSEADVLLSSAPSAAALPPGIDDFVVVVVAVAVAVAGPTEGPKGGPSAAAKTSEIESSLLLGSSVVVVSVSPFTAAETPEIESSMLLGSSVVVVSVLELGSVDVVVEVEDVAEDELVLVAELVLLEDSELEVELGIVVETEDAEEDGLVLDTEIELDVVDESSPLESASSLLGSSVVVVSLSPFTAAETPEIESSKLPGSSVVVVSVRPFKGCGCGCGCGCGVGMAVVVSLECGARPVDFPLHLAITHPCSSTRGPCGQTISSTAGQHTLPASATS